MHWCSIKKKKKITTDRLIFLTFRASQHFFFWPKLLDYTKKNCQINWPFQIIVVKTFSKGVGESVQNERWTIAYHLNVSHTYNCMNYICNSWFSPCVKILLFVWFFCLFVMFVCVVFVLFLFFAFLVSVITMKWFYNNSIWNRIFVMEINDQVERCKIIIISML